MTTGAEPPTCRILSTCGIYCFLLRGIFATRLFFFPDLDCFLYCTHSSRVFVSFNKFLLIHLDWECVRGGGGWRMVETRDLSDWVNREEEVVIYISLLLLSRFLLPSLSLLRCPGRAGSHCIESLTKMCSFSASLSYSILFSRDRQFPRDIQWYRQEYRHSDWHYRTWQDWTWCHRVIEHVFEECLTH